MICRHTILLILGVFTLANLQAQDTTASIQQLPSKYLYQISNKADQLEQKLDKKTNRVLKKMLKMELKLKEQLFKKDSTAAKKMFAGIEAKYESLRQRFTESKPLSITNTQYSPYLDTLKTSLKFLKGNADKLFKQSPELQNKLENAISKTNVLGIKMNQAQVIQQFLKERRQYLKQQLSKFELAGQLKNMNKQVYYYSQAIKEYKEILKNPKKIEEKAIAILREIPAFKKFMRNNSQFASIFSISPESGTSTSAVSFAGLQTRASAQQMIQSTLGNTNPQQFIAQQLQDANKKLSDQKNAIRVPDIADNLGEMPDFKPNDQKSKPFLNRLEFGTNFQFGRVNNLLPSTADIGFSLGYKLNNEGTVGIGSSYKLGLGNNIQNIRLTHQGFGMRSYIDWKIKGGFYIAGGYEKNYWPTLSDIELNHSMDAWQQSGLIGISKKYNAGKKRKGSVQLLFDFLSFYNSPRSQPIIFRSGINF